MAVFVYHVGGEARVQKNKNDIPGFVISVFLAPVLGLVVAMMMLVGLGEPGQSIGEMARFCSYPQDFPNRDCAALHQALQLRNFALLALGGTILLPLGYSLAVFVLARNRAALGRGFPILVRICLLLLPVILVGHAALVALDTLNLYQLGLFPRSSLLMIAIALVVCGLLLSAFNILAGMRGMLAIDPLRVTGIAVEESKLPALYARARLLAQKLGAVAPRQIVLGIEPTPFMTSMPVRLRGIGDLPEGETLYLSTLALEVLDDGELDAILAQELAHFRGPDLVFSQKFAPAHAGLLNAVDSVSDDANESAWVADSAIARVRFAVVHALGVEGARRPRPLRARGTGRSRRARGGDRATADFRGGQAHGARRARAAVSAGNDGAHESWRRPGATSRRTTCHEPETFSRRRTRRSSMQTWRGCRRLIRSMCGLRWVRARMRCRSTRSRSSSRA